MHDREKAEFGKLLHATATYYDRKLTPDTVAIYWQGLRDLSLEVVRGAVNAHVQDPTSGQFMPKIADIRRQIEAHRDDGHVGAEEAWSIALQARHESASVVWTEQISAAFFQAALPLLDAGDKIAARKAFQERYEQALAEARRAGVSATWIASLGSDPNLREQAVEQAVRLQRITAEHGQRLLPRTEPLDDAALARIEHDVGRSTRHAAEQIEALRRMLGTS